MGGEEEPARLGLPRQDSATERELFALVANRAQDPVQAGRGALGGPQGLNRPPARHQR
jgi:hypothetical protein